MAATGNVKISELTQLQASQIDQNIMVPTSWAPNGGSAYESYKITGKDLISYAGLKLGLYQSIDPETGYAYPGPVTTYLYSYGQELSYLERDLGQYAGGLDGNFCENHSIDLSIGTQNYYIKSDGTTASKSNWSISSAVTVRQGTLYLLQIPAGTVIPEDTCLFAKKYTHSYYAITGYDDVTLDDGTIVKEPIYGAAYTETVYEPCSFHYDKYSNLDHSGYGLPKSNYVVFYATEDEDIVVSCLTTTISGKKLYAVHYGIFSEIAEKYLGTNTDMGQVVSESIASLDGRIRTLEDNLETSNPDFMSMPKFRGSDLFTYSDHEPMSTNYCVDEYGAYITDPTGLVINHAPDYINFPGQLWVTDSNVWIGLVPGTATWHQVSIS